METMVRLFFDALWTVSELGRAGGEKHGREMGVGGFLLCRREERVEEGGEVRMVGEDKDGAKDKVVTV